MQQTLQARLGSSGWDGVGVGWVGGWGGRVEIGYPRRSSGGRRGLLILISIVTGALVMGILTKNNWHKN